MTTLVLFLPECRKLQERGQFSCPPSSRVLGCHKATKPRPRDCGGRLPLGLRQRSAQKMSKGYRAPFRSDTNPGTKKAHVAAALLEWTHGRAIGIGRPHSTRHRHALLCFDDKYRASSAVPTRCFGRYTAISYTGASAERKGAKPTKLCGQVTM